MLGIILKETRLNQFSGNTINLVTIQLNGDRYINAAIEEKGLSLN